MDQEHLKHYARGGEELALSIRGLTDEDLRCVPAKDAGVGLWSIQQVVMHLADCDLVFADRMKRVISEDNPALPAFDENKWAAALQYDHQSVQDAITITDLNRKQMGRVLAKLPASAFTRSGTHSVSGKKTLADLVSGAVKHMEHHLKFIHAKRAKMGKEMW